MDLTALASCRELTTEHVEHAARSPDALRALLARVADIAMPEDGGAKILFVLARLARGDVPWLEGDVTVELTGDDAATTLDLFNEQGWGIKERLAPRARFAVPLDEFARAVEISARRFEPLRATVHPDKVILSSAPPAASAPPPPVELDENSVGTAPPPALVAREPDPFSVPPAAEPDPFGAPPAIASLAELAEPDALTTELDDPGDSFGAFLDDPATPLAPPAPPTAPPPPPKKHDSVHSRPTVRRMVAIKPEALRTGRKDPRREEDD